MSADEAVQLAAIGILEEHYRKHLSEANREKVYSVYVNATPIPDDAQDAVKIVEQTLIANCAAKAIFHSNEAYRFQNALMKLKGQI